MPRPAVVPPPDPIKFAESLARWRVDREFLIAFALEKGWNSERNLRLGRRWLQRYPPTIHDPPHVVLHRAELCQRLGLPAPDQPKPPEPRRWTTTVNHRSRKSAT